MPIAKVPTAVRPWVGRLVRLGYVAKGLIYFLIGVRNRLRQRNLYDTGLPPAEPS